MLDLSLLRREQFWFTERNAKTLATELFTLWDCSDRKARIYTRATFKNTIAPSRLLAEVTRTSRIAERKHNAGHRPRRQVIYNALCA